MSRLKLLITIPVLAVALISGGTWAYINFVHEDAPAPLALDGSTAAESAAAPAGVDGTWTATTGSQAGYRVGENLFGQDTEAVGRTDDVDGGLVIAGTSVTSAKVTVDLTTVASNEGRRDNQFRGRIMNVATYPRATFELVKAIDLGTLPADGEQVTVPASGKLTLRGTTNAVSVDLSARRNGSTIEVVGSIPVTFVDYGIPNPSFGPVSADDHGQIEFKVIFTRA
jgi:polyisoprenoid-binding protein YceI